MGLTNEEHAELAAWADEICERRRPQGTPNCPFCKLWRGKDVEMLFRHGNIHTDPVAWGQNRKCPECFHIESFGLPMTEGEYQRTHDLQKGRHTTASPSKMCKVANSASNCRRSATCLCDAGSIFAVGGQ